MPERTISGTDKNNSRVDVNSGRGSGSTGSTGVAMAVKKGAQTQTLEVHGTVAGVTVDNPA